MISLVANPSPGGPQRNMFFEFPNISNSGLDLSYNSVVPPIIIVRSPLAADAIPPETGESTYSPIPEFITWSRTLFAVPISIVEHSRNNFGREGLDIDNNSSKTIWTALPWGNEVKIISY